MKREITVWVCPCRNTEPSIFIWWNLSGFVLIIRMEKKQWQGRGNGTGEVEREKGDWEGMVGGSVWVDIVVEADFEVKVGRKM